MYTLVEYFGWLGLLVLQVLVIAFYFSTHGTLASRFANALGMTAPSDAFATGINAYA